MNVAIVGAGTIGSSLALACALHGHQTVLCGRPGGAFYRAQAAIDSAFEELVDADLLPPTETGWRGRLRFVQNQAQLPTTTDIVIEAAPETLALKQQIFYELDRQFPGGTLLASSTSALPVDEIGMRCSRRDRIAVAHFANPPHLMPAVEIVPGSRTDADATEALTAFVKSLGKIPIVLGRDIPGHLFNRLQFAMLREAVALVATGVATPTQVDEVVKNGLALRLAEEGPFEKMDLAGLDLVYSVASFLYPTLDRSVAADAFLPLLNSGRRGAAYGEGFYQWTPERARLVVQRRNAEVIRHLKRRRDDSK